MVGAVLQSTTTARGELFQEVNPEGVVYWQDVCGNGTFGGVFWDTDRILNGTFPDLPWCFEVTVLVWIPIFFLWISSPFHVATLINRKTRFGIADFTWILLAKLIISIALAGLALTDLIYTVVQDIENDPNPPPAFYIDSSLSLITFILVIFFHVYEHMKAANTSGVLWVFWALYITCAIPQFSSRVYRAAKWNELGTEVRFTTFFTSFILAFIASILSDFSDNGPKTDENGAAERAPLLGTAKNLLHKSNDDLEDHQRDKALELRASFLSQITHSWITPLMIRGVNHQIDSDDLPDIREDEKTLNNWKVFDEEWKSVDYAVLKTKSSWDLLQACLDTATLPLIKAFFLRLVVCFTEFVNPMLLLLIVRWQEQTDPLYLHAWQGYLLVCVLLLANIIHSLCTHQFFKYSTITAMRIRGALSLAIYKKALKLAWSPRNPRSVEQLVSLINADTQRVIDAVTDMHELWAAPVMLIIAMLILWYVIGWGSIAGLAVIILLAPINGGLLVRQLGRLQEQHAINKEKRTWLVTEVFSAIKVVKMYAWESELAKRIGALRIRETEGLRTQSFLNSGVSIIWYCTPYLVVLVMFITYIAVYDGQFVSASNAFVAILVANTLNWCASFLPIHITMAYRASRSMGRLCDMLQRPELRSFINRKNDDAAISVRDGYFTWNHGLLAELPLATIQNMNLEIGEGHLVVIVGHKKSGKSSLLSMITGDLNKLQGTVNVKGSISMVPQMPWVQQATIADNITFGRRMHHTRYEKVVEACGLNKTIDIMKHDQNIENGVRVTMTKGQRQQLALARATFQNKDIYLLDDPLSDVSDLVRKNIYHQVIGPSGMLRRKTRLLVTGDLTLASEADLVIVMEDGRMVEAGAFLQLIQQNGVFTRLAHEYLENNRNSNGSESSSDSSISEMIKNLRVNDEDDKDTDNGEDNISSLSGSTDMSQKTSNQKPGRALHKSTEFTRRMHEAHDIVGIRDPIRKRLMMNGEPQSQPGINWGMMEMYFKEVGWAASLLILFLSLCYIASLCLTYIWLAMWVDDPIGPAEQEETHDWLRLLVFAVFGCLQMFFMCLLSCVVYYGSLNASISLHGSMLKHVLLAPLQFFDQTSMTTLINRFSVDVEKLDVGIPQFARLWLLNVATVLGIVVLICYSVPIFFIFALVIFILYIIIQRVYTNTIQQLRLIDARQRTASQTFLEDSLAGITTVRGFKQQQSFIDTYTGKVDDSQVAWYHVAIGQRWLGFWLDVIGSLVIFCVAILLINWRDSLSSGEIALALAFAMQTSWTVNMLVRGAAELEANTTCLERIDEFCNLPSEGAWEREDLMLEDLWPESGVVEFRDLNVKDSSNANLLLSEIDLKVNSKEKIAILGSPGESKSALMLALFRLLSADNGSIVIDDKDIATIGLHQLRKRVALIPDEPIVFSGTLHDNLDPGNIYTTRDIWRALEVAHLKSFVNMFPEGLTMQCGPAGRNLSSSQRRLVCLARALLRVPRLMLVNDPAYNGDPETEALIQSVLRSDFANCSIIFLTDKVKSVLDYDRVAVLKDGKISEIGPPTELMKQDDSLFHSMAADQLDSSELEH